MHTLSWIYIVGMGAWSAAWGGYAFSQLKRVKTRLGLALMWVGVVSNAVSIIILCVMAAMNITGAIP